LSARHTLVRRVITSAATQWKHRHDRRTTGETAGWKTSADISE